MKMQFQFHSHFCLACTNVLIMHCHTLLAVTNSNACLVSTTQKHK